MIKLNTNLSSLIVQSNLSKSTDMLNAAIERMTSGFKINHAKDNAAGYSISERMSSQISSYEVAEDNATMGLDIVETASSSLAIIEDRLSRLRILQEQAMNGTYGADSLAAINQECNCLVDEINRLYYTTEYNGINLFLDKSDVNNKPEYQELNANKDTTFDELGLTSYNFSVYDSNNSLLEDITMTAENTIGEFLERLSAYDINGKISNGVITLSSSNGSYISGGLADELGISVIDKTYIEYSSQSSSSAITYEKTTTADSNTTFSVLGITSDSEVLVYDNVKNVLGTISVSASDTVDSLFNSLSAYGINGKIENGVITLDSDSGNYAAGDLMNALGIGVQNLPSVTLITTATISSTISDYYSGNSYNITIVNTETSGEEVISIGARALFSDLKTALAGHNMSLDITDGVMTISSSNKYLYAKGDMLDSFGVSVVPNGTYTQTVVNSMTSSTKMTYSTITTTTTTQTQTVGGTFLQSVTQIDTTGMQSVSEVNLRNLKSGTFAIRTTSDLEQLALLNPFDETDRDFTFILANDIDYGGNDWETISVSTHLHMVFDGNGFVIRNVKSSDGLFSNVSSIGSEIKNLGMENIVIEYNQNYTDKGCLCDDLQDGKLINCYVSGGSIDLSSFGGSFYYSVGGLVGNMYNGLIENCYSSVTINAASNTYSEYVGCGGIVGQASGTVRNCYSEAIISSMYMNNGGIVGCNSDAFNDLTISNCEFSGEIKIPAGDGFLGGMVGHISASNCYIENCVVDALLKALYGIGAGLVGEISSSYSTLEVTNSYVNSHNGDYYDYGVVNGVDFDANVIIKNTSHSEGMELYNPSNSNVTSSGSWNSSYAPVFNYYPTEVVTTVLQTKTSVIDATSGVSLSTLGINSGALTLMVNGVSKELQYSSGYTLQNFIESLKTYGITASLSGGKLTIVQNNNAFIISDSGNLAQTAGLDLSKSYSTSEGTLYTNTPSHEISKTRIEQPGANTPSKVLGLKSIYTLSETTTLSDINLGGNYQVKVNGRNVNISLKSSDSFADFITKLKTVGIDASISNGIFSLRGDGESGIFASALISALKLGKANYTEGVHKENTNSNKMTYIGKIPGIDIEGIYAPGSFVLQVGINSDEASQIKIETCFKLSPTEALRGIGVYDEDYLSSIDKMLSEITLKQTELGAIQNRLVSALDEINTHYENLISSRSTLRDADIAEVSSEYIRSQMLQQASATLLSTVNQSPSIALQLL